MGVKARKRTKKAAAKKQAARADGPVTQAREIIKKMSRSKRKDVLAACVAAGINKNTAATEYTKYHYLGGKK